MKFITSTHLKQWADTKECQQLLPELIRRLIEASLTNVDRLSFPSGDAVSAHGWDGIVSCDESIDLVPKGVSLWECGATRDKQGKINHDFGVREEDPLGYDKRTSTFVLVTPRIWEGADEWMREHQNGWKKVVVYTAVELERWIESRPSVGMWLAEKLRILPSGGYMLPETYWNRWAQGEKMTLPYEIILPGREEICQRVVDTCKTPSSLVIQALSQSEGIAFAIASVLNSEESESLRSRLVVVTEKSAFDDLVEHYDNLTILTTLTDSIKYVVKRGHSVIIAATPADQIRDAVALPIIEKEGFVDALVKVGVDETKARKIAKDTARDVNALRRRVKIEIDKPVWADTNALEELLPAFLVGKWYDTIDGDKQVLESLSRMNYADYETKLQIHLSKEETPLIHIGNMWRIRSPYEVVDYVQCMLSDSHLCKLREVCLNLVQDDAPDAVDRIENDGFMPREFKQKYSSTIKEGVFQNLVLMSIEDRSKEKKLCNWVDETVSIMLKDWDLKRFLSNRHYLTALAEASPSCFMDFMEKLPKEVVEVIFKPRTPAHSFFGWDISYTEVLFAVEMLAWEEEYLNRVTKLLFCYSEYENESNYANKPINSLYNIYRLFLPQTYVAFEDRMSLLKAYSSKYKEIVFKLCMRMCESIDRGTFEPNQYFKWRMFGKIETPKYFNQITVDELNEVVTLMLQCCSYSAEKITKLLALSTNKNMKSCRDAIITAVREHLVDLDDKQVVTDALRKDITRHISYKDASWSLSSNELKKYEDLLEEMEPKDMLHKNAWLFEFGYVRLPHDRKKKIDFEQERKELLEERTNAIQEVVDSQGKDGIWAFVKIVKCPESLADSLVLIFGSDLFNDVCQKYKSKEIGEGFARSYFSVLCHSDTTAYQEMVRQTIEKDKDLLVLLYAPRYIKGLADMAASFGDSIKRKYWESVDVSFLELGDAVEVINELIKVDRYSDAINVIYHNKQKIHMSDVKIAQVIYGYITCGTKNISQMDPCYLSNLLEDLDKSEDPEVIKTLIVVEFLLYRVLEHEMDMKNSRFVKELTRDPSLMIQLVEMAFVPDDGVVEQLDDDVAMENRQMMAKNAFHVFYFGCRMVPGMEDNGNLDDKALTSYVDQLYELAKEKKRTNVIDSIVGNMLGDIPRNDSYPPKVLCEIVEKLNSDVVDDHIRMRIYNSRGVTSRSYNEGGGKERHLVSKLEQYKEKTRLLYPRMTKIFNDLIKEYNNEAARTDDEAFIADLEY